MAIKYRHFGSGLFKPGACDGAGRMVVAAVLLCASICARGETVTEEPDAFLEYIEAHGTISYSYSDENFIAGPELVVMPSYLEGADDQMKAKYNAWAATYGPDTTGEHEAAFLLNVAQTATSVELRVIDVDVVEGGARIRVAAEAGGDGVDLSHANGVIYVAAGDTLTNLVEKPVPNPTFSGDGQTATIQVPSTSGAFVKVVVGISAPSEP